MNTKEDFIAVFDSGVGGISVLRHLRRLMPGERYLYFGDSANAPYGTKTKDEVEALTFAAARHLMARGVKALVVACNTATSAFTICGKPIRIPSSSASSLPSSWPTTGITAAASA